MTGKILKKIDVFFLLNLCPGSDAALGFKVDLKLTRYPAVYVNSLGSPSFFLTLGTKSNATPRKRPAIGPRINCDWGISERRRVTVDINKVR